MDNYFREIWTNIYLRKDNDVNFPVHIHDDIEFVYVIQGGGHSFCDGIQYTLTPGSVFIAFPNQVHSFSDCTPGEYILLIINPSRLLYLEQFFRSQIPTVASVSVTEELIRPLLDALQEFVDYGDSCVIDGYITAMFSKLFRCMQFQRSPYLNNTVSRILHYCSQNYREPITIPDLCCALHISQSSVSHIFSKRLKISFPNYMNALRLNHAVALLREPGLSISEIVDRAGFPTIRTFNRVFRKQFGCSPSEYRTRLAKSID